MDLTKGLLASKTFWFSLLVGVPGVSMVISGLKTGDYHSAALGATTTLGWLGTLWGRIVATKQISGL